MHCEKCQTKPEGKVLEAQFNNSDWNDWVRYYFYKNGAEKHTEFDEVFLCYKCFPHLEEYVVPDKSMYNEGYDRYQIISNIDLDPDTELWQSVGESADKPNHLTLDSLSVLSTRR